ncbi:hypothetical protein EIN_328860 [Entamoeba invadens IP1]|uniref:Uncharacterized protein n=1 Tax=Entamoeba invadens IP1 TaxID=370355 RepID=A0A0A1TXU3_ENTIV|nr:hypothetical protein EIN_328860 [Entamoeba invadens IP1]ELP86179.1 hypothetical protein EIN_328860 [Entamoeba invadens IP1]|eukprot:XP_004185525.1 hypothetical protein EIN_328860 [Entamoeba invadens IP1]
MVMYWHFTNKVMLLVFICIVSLTFSQPTKVVLTMSKTENVILSPPYTDLESNKCELGKHKGVLYEFKNTSPRNVKLNLDFYNNPPNKIHVALFDTTKCLVKQDSKTHLSEIRHIVRPSQTIHLAIYSTNEKGEDVDARVVVRIRSNLQVVRSSPNRGKSCPDASPLFSQMYFRGTGVKWYTIKVMKNEKRVITTCSGFTQMPVKLEIYDTCSGHLIDFTETKCNTANGVSGFFKAEKSGRVYLKVTPLPGLRKDVKTKSLKTQRRLKRKSPQVEGRRTNRSLDRYAIETFSDTQKTHYAKCEAAKVISSFYVQDNVHFMNFAKTKSECGGVSRAAYYKIFVPRKVSVQMNTCGWKNTGSSKMSVIEKCGGKCLNVKTTKCQSGRGERLLVRGESKSRWVYLRVEETDESDIGNVMVQISRIGGNLLMRRKFVRRPFWLNRILRMRGRRWRGNRRFQYGRNGRYRRFRKYQVIGKKIQQNTSKQDQNKKRQMEKKMEEKNRRERLVTNFEKSLRNKDNTIQNYNNKLNTQNQVKQEQEVNKNTFERNQKKEVKPVFLDQKVSDVKIVSLERNNSSTIVKVLLGVVGVSFLGVSGFIAYKVFLKKKTDNNYIPL